LIALLAALVIVALAGPALRREVGLRALLAAPSITRQSIEEIVAANPRPLTTLGWLWKSGRIPHRREVAEYLRARIDLPPEWRETVTRWMRVATRDVDLELRLVAFAILRFWRAEGVDELARAQLSDADPDARLIGLDNLLDHASPHNLSAAFARLEDSDWRVRTRAASLLRRWTGEDFGVRGSVPPSASEEERKAFAARLDEGLKGWRQWRAEHPDLFAAERPEPPIGPPGPLGPPVEFTLPDLEGRPVSVDGFRGRVVLLNFWATWCFSCVAEIPDLAELARANPDKLIVIGISLDGAPDEHDHGGGAADEHAGHEHARDEAVAIRKKLRRFVKDRGVPYLVLHDATGAVAERFLGGELPTNVLLDRAGRVRRRFMGSRSPAAFQAMVDELAPSASADHHREASAR